MMAPRALASRLEEGAALPDAPDRERLRGYAVPAVPFDSGHLLAMRRFPASSIGPAYTSLWHRHPDGTLIIYQDQQPRHGCPRAFGPAIDDARVVPIALEWPGPHHFTMAIDTPDVRLRWEVPLSSNVITRGLNTVSSMAPERILGHPVTSAAIGRMVGPLLRAGRVRLTGRVPSRQAFHAHMRRVWLIEGGAARVDGTDLGEPGQLPSQRRLADFWLPQKGLFAVVDAFFEAFDPAMHHQVASRRELT